MVAYFIAEVEVVDQAAYERYKPVAEASIAAHGGRYLVRGGAAEALEGAPPKRIVVLEFPSAAAAYGWYRSEEYAPGLKLRLECARSRVMIVEGVPGG
jgi:uncharacterized protein (DUF1330 family)